MSNCPTTLQEAIIFFADDENCQRFMTAIRWADGKVRCPHCDSEEVTYLAKQRRWKCYGKHPKAQFSLKVGTIFEDSPLGLDKWLSAAWLIADCKNGISSYELARDLGVTQKSAWFMLHRIRLAMQTGTFQKLSVDVEADETFVGGKLRNMNNKARTRKFLREGKLPGGGTVGKAIVMGLLERHGKARVKVVPNDLPRFFQPVITEDFKTAANSLGVR
jgi:transposase-like protein